MNIDQLIEKLQQISETHPNIEVELQGPLDGSQESEICGYPDFFMVAEEYDDGWYVNLRTWPY